MNVAADARFAWRLMTRRPGFAVVALLSLALGLGLNTAIFTLLDTVLWRPFEARDPDGLVAFYGTLRAPTGEYLGARAFSYDDYLVIRDGNDFLSQVALHMWQPVYRTGDNHPEKLRATFTSDNYFETLGMVPALGRLLRPGDAATLGAGSVAVVSHSFWRTFYAADPTILGSRLTLNGADFEVVGVAPEGFQGLDLQISSDVFLPVSMYPEIGRYADLFRNQEVAIFRIFGRLHEGVTVDGASARIMALVRKMVASLPPDFEPLGARAVSLRKSSIRPGDRQRYQAYGRTLAATGALFVFVVCFNVANLLLLRGLERGRALAIRRVLGADRRRLVRQLVTENLLLFGAGGLLGIPVARASLTLFWRFRPVQFGEGALEPRLGVAALLFAIAAALVMGVVFGILPALRASGSAALTHLRSGPPVGEFLGRRFSWRNALATAQVALAFAAIAGGGLLVQSLRNAHQLDLGFEPESLFVLTVAPGAQGYSAPRAEELYRQIREDVVAVPGVEAAGWSENRLLRGAVANYQVYLPTSDEAQRIGDRDYHRTTVVDPPFFEAVGLSLLTGRTFSSSDRAEGPRVAIINSTMADWLWPGSDAVGRTFRLNGPTGPLQEVVGVVEDARYREIREEPQFFLYLPLSQNYVPGMTLHVRAAGDPADVAAAVIARVRWLDPGLVVSETAPLSVFVDEALWAERTSAFFLSVFSLLSCAMAVLGIYAMVAFATTLRASELGIRSALGATASQLVRPALMDAARVIIVGLAVGWLVAALWIGPLFASQLHDVGTHQPATFAFLSLGFLALGLLSSWISSRGVARLDPARALYAE